MATAVGQKEDLTAHTEATNGCAADDTTGEVCLLLSFAIAPYVRKVTTRAKG